MSSFSLHTIKTAVMAVVVGVLITACQSVPRAGAFAPEQEAALQSFGFVEMDDRWELAMPDRLLFAVNESRLGPDQEARIGDMAKKLSAVGILKARVEGHTDSTGSAAYNLKLSKARAEAVAAPLAANGMMFLPHQIAGRGESYPLSSNATPEGRQDNRRVVVIVEPQ